MAKPDSGLWRGPSLEAGLCCHDSVPLLAKPVAVCGELDRLSDRVGDGNGRGDAVSGSFDGEVLPLTAFVCEWVFGWGLKSTGGLRARSAVDGESNESDEVLAGPVFDGDIDRALSSLLACRSCLPFRNSSSMRRVASFLPCGVPAILARNWSTDSDPSLLALMVVMVIGCWGTVLAYACWLSKGISSRSLPQ